MIKKLMIIALFIAVIPAQVDAFARNEDTPKIIKWGRILVPTACFLWWAKGHFFSAPVGTGVCTAAPMPFVVSELQDKSLSDLEKDLYRSESGLAKSVKEGKAKEEKAKKSRKESRKDKNNQRQGNRFVLLQTSVQPSENMQEQNKPWEDRLKEKYLRSQYASKDDNNNVTPVVGSGSQSSASMPIGGQLVSVERSLSLVPAVSLSPVHAPAEINQTRRSIAEIFEKGNERIAENAEEEREAARRPFGEFNCTPGEGAGALARTLNNHEAAINAANQNPQARGFVHNARDLWDDIHNVSRAVTQVPAYCQRVAGAGRGVYAAFSTLNSALRGQGQMPS